MFNNYDLGSGARKTRYEMWQRHQSCAFYQSTCQNSLHFTKISFDTDTLRFSLKQATKYSHCGAQLSSSSTTQAACGEHTVENSRESIYFIWCTPFRFAQIYSNNNNNIYYTFSIIPYCAAGEKHYIRHAHGIRHGNMMTHQIWTYYTFYMWISLKKTVVTATNSGPTLAHRWKWSAFTHQSGVYSEKLSLTNYFLFGWWRRNSCSEDNAVDCSISSFIYEKVQWLSKKSYEKIYWGPFSSAD